MKQMQKLTKKKRVASNEEMKFMGIPSNVFKHWEHIVWVSFFQDWNFSFAENLRLIGMWVRVTRQCCYVCNIILYHKMCVYVFVVCCLFYFHLKSETLCVVCTSIFLIKYIQIENSTYATFYVLLNQFTVDNKVRSFYAVTHPYTTHNKTHTQHTPYNQWRTCWMFHILEFNSKWFNCGKQHSCTFRDTHRERKCDANGSNKHWNDKVHIHKHNLFAQNVDYFCFASIAQGNILLRLSKIFEMEMFVCKMCVCC